MIMIDKSKNKRSEVDQEINQNKFNIFYFFNSNKKIFIIVGVLILVLTILLPVTNNLKQDSVSSKNGLSIKLLGKSTVTVATKAEFLDPGYMAIDKKDGDLTKEVQIIGIVDFNTPGTYERYYVVENSSGTIVEVKRTIIVKDNYEEDIKLTLTLKGSTEVELEKGDTYQELGYVAYDSTGEDLTKEVKVNSDLKNNILGTYKITYTLTVEDFTKTVTRTVKVVDKKIDNTNVNINTDITVNNSNLTSGSVRITLKITGTGYDYTVLPSGYKSYNTTINYTVSNNGTYVFNVYDKNGGVKTVEKTITNIDNQAPIVTCTGEIKDDNKTYLKAEAIDDSGSLSYEYKSGTINTGKISSNTYIINSRTKSATVTVYDKVGNYTVSDCSILGDIDKVYLPIVPKKYKYHDSSDTLKVWISQESGYTLTRIWAKNPYKQFHTYVSTDYGKSYDKFINIFDNAIKNNANGIKNKIAIAFNESVSYKYGQKSNDFNKYTKMGLIIHEGKVLRNDPTSKKRFRNDICWIDKKNQIRYIDDIRYEKERTPTRTEAIIKGYNEAVNEGALTTVVCNQIAKNGKNTYKRSKSAYAAVINGFCQIDSNNFIYITTGSGWWGEKLSDTMIKLGCKEAYNYDGGGSTNVFFKKDTASKWTHVRGSGARGPSWSISYWTEL